MNPGDKVRVTIEVDDGDTLHFPATVEGVQGTGQDEVWVSTSAGQHLTVDRNAVVPVTPPCPWTYEGTPIVVQYQRPIVMLETRTAILDEVGWHNENGMALAWATDIAPYNPARLVPEQPARGDDVVEERWLYGTPVIGAFDLEFRAGYTVKQKVYYGPLTEIDATEVTS